MMVFTISIFQEFILRKNVIFNYMITVPSHNKHTHNKHFSHNKHTLFALTKMCLFGEEEDFGKQVACIFDMINFILRNFRIFLPMI